MKKTILLFNPRPDPYLKPIDLPLSLLCISRFLDRDGYDIKIVSDNLYDDPFEVLKKTARQSLILGVSAMTGNQIYDGIKASKLVKEENPDIKVVWGGWHPSILPRQVLENPYIDIVVKGQGARALHDVVKRIEKEEGFSGLPGVHWKEKGEFFSNPDRALEPMDDWPPIPYHLLDVEKCLIVTEFGNRTINYVSSYGCPYRCSFCSEITVNKRQWIGLNAEAVVDDLERLEKVYGVNGVNLYDSLFFVNIKRAKAILRGIVERGLTLRLGNVDGRSRQLAEADDELWELLRKSRTYSILCGAESGEQEALDIVNKDMEVEDNIRFAKKCREYGIKVVFSTLVGVPIPNHSHEELAKKTDGQIISTIDMLDRVLSFDNRHRGQMFIYFPFPGTPLYDSARKLGFQEPKKLEDWANMKFYQKHTPWITKNQERLVAMISSYIFMFMDSDTLIWARERIENPVKKSLFVFSFKIFTWIVRFRWKNKFFDFPIDYTIFLFAKKHNKSI